MLASSTYVADAIVPRIIKRQRFRRRLGGLGTFVALIVLLALIGERVV